MADADLTLKQGDTYPAVRFTLSDKTGPVDLTSATTISLLLKSASQALITKTCTKDPDQVNKRGQATVSFSSADTASATVFSSEAKVDWGGGSIQHFPNKGYRTIEVVTSLG